MKLNNKIERLKTVSKLPKPKCSIKWIRKEFKLLIDFMESRTQNKYKHNHRREILMDTLDFNGINYSLVNQLSFYLVDGIVEIQQYPIAIFINSYDGMDQPITYFFYKGSLGQSGAQWQIYGNNFDNWKVPSNGRAWYNIESRIDIHSPEENDLEKITLLFQIPYFKKFYKNLLKQKNINFLQFYKYILEWNTNKWIETSLKENWFPLFSTLRARSSDNTLNKLLDLGHEPKCLAKKIIEKYGKSYCYKNTIFKDTLSLGRSVIPNWNDDMLFKSWKAVERLHERATVINGKITKEMSAKATQKLLILQKQLKRKSFNKNSIEIIKPKSKKELLKAGQEMNNCIKNFNPKNIYLVNIILKEEKYMVGVEWKPEDETWKQVHSYNNYNLPKNWKSGILKEIAGLRKRN